MTSEQKQIKKLKKILRESLAFNVKEEPTGNTLRVYVPKQMAESKKIVKAEIFLTDARWN